MPQASVDTLPILPMWREKSESEAGAKGTSNEIMNKKAVIDVLLMIFGRETGRVHSKPFLDSIFGL